ncbi:MAG: hypothetical protein SCALA702_21000 [Melioribacteraceae bacterium]|nr:MAG: hypothetical protein SCALA702_21000 [Melioribacteraceae bacterium]
MSDERFVELVEKFLDNELSPSEETELNKILDANPSFKSELEEQIKVKEAMRKMMMKNPNKEVWDGYWQRSYNKTERGIAWFVFILGIIIVAGYAIVEIADNLMNDTSIPLFLKIGIAFSIGGGLFLLFTVFRERLFTSKNDKYKEIQR